jgi:hypothetical protein
VVLAATRPDGVDLLLDVVAATEHAKSAHQANVVRAKPADREDAQPPR